MKKSLWGRVALCMLAAAAIAAPVLSTADRFVSQVFMVCRSIKFVVAKWLGDLVTGALSLASRQRAPVLRGLTFTRLKAFRERLVRRQRPQVTPTWRMCPST